MLISADDRTGAAEVAGALADRLGFPIAVGTRSTFTATAGQSTDLANTADGALTHRVIDIATRHLSPAEAGEAMSPLATVVGAHKMDSTLRGNWSEEVGALVDARRRVLVVAALPTLGRVCVGGVVYEHGRPVHEGPAGSDVRRRVTTSSTTEMLATAGLPDVPVLKSPDEVVAWQTSDSACAVADVVDADALVAVASAWATDPTSVIVGTSESIAAAVAALTKNASAVRGDVAPSASLPVFDGPALVVCGSLHPVARDQLAHIARAGVTVTDVADEHSTAVLHRGEPLVLASELPSGPVDSPLAIAAASGLARDTEALLDAASVGVVVVVGGDTAGAVIGDREFTVSSTAGAGMPIGRVDGFAPPFITRAGGFGSVDSLDRLVRYQLQP